MKTEVIKNIEQIYDYQLEEDTYADKDGYKITTNNQEIFVLIDNGQCCCEQWGYFDSQDGDFSKFIGAEIKNVYLTDDKLNTYELDKEFVEWIYDSDETTIQFVNIETSRGLFQLAVYNSHNGYYGHSILIKSTQVNYDGYL